MRFLFLLFAVGAFAAPNSLFEHPENGELDMMEEAKKLIELTEAILKGSDFSRDGNLEEAAKKAEGASRIAASLVEMRAPGLKREDAEVLKRGAEEATRAASSNDKEALEEAITSMEHQLEKILENIEDLIKEKEEELEGSEHMAPVEQADVPIGEDQTSMKDLEAATKHTVHGDPMIPAEHKEKAIDYTHKSAKEGFKQAGTTNGKLRKLSENEENWEEERPHHHRFHLFGSKDHKKCGKSRRFNWNRCARHFGHRFCRRVFYRRFLHHRGFHHFFHHQQQQQQQDW